MRRTFSLSFRKSLHVASASNSSQGLANAPIINIQSATFYRHHPNPVLKEENPPLFPNLTFNLPSQPILHYTSAKEGKDEPVQQHWAVLGNISKTTFLEVLKGVYISIPPSARSYPYLSSEIIAQKDPALRIPSRAIQYVGFAGDRGQSSGGVRGAYLSARYESRREETDWSVLQYLRGETELNPVGKDLEEVRWDADLLENVIKDLRLGKLVDMPVGNLSNGQTRRARIAKALLGRPEVLLLDEPFMGLDPPTLTTLSPILRDLAYKSSPRLVLSLRPQDPVPDWITHLVVLGEESSVALQGKKEDVLAGVVRWTQAEHVHLASGDVVPALEMTKLHGPPLAEAGHILSERSTRKSATDLTSVSQRSTTSTKSTTAKTVPESLIELKSIIVKYGSKVVLGGGDPPGLSLTISRGTRILILGPNGSGKTTLLSLLTSDHPQSYSLPVHHFGRTRLPKVGEPGLSLFDIQSRIGHSSPEIHAFFPKTASIRSTLESAWAETFIAKPMLPNFAHADIDAVLRWFEAELNPAYHHHRHRHQHKDARTNIGDGTGPQQDLSWATSPITNCSRPSSPPTPVHPFSTLPFQTQRLLLLLRAIIKHPDILILDEAFSGLSPYVREKAIAFLETGMTTRIVPDPDRAGQWMRRKIDPDEAAGLVEGGEESIIRFRGLTDRQALVVVSHIREEVPGCVREWLRLPGDEELDFAAAAAAAATTTTNDAGTSARPMIVGARRGVEDAEGGGVAKSEEGWRRIWGLS